MGPDRPEGTPGAAFDWADHDIGAEDAPAAPRTPREPTTQAAPEADAGADQEPPAGLRVTNVPDRPLVPAPGQAKKRPRAATKPPERAYPMMRALLASPELVPYGSDPLPTALPPPVPGTFIRAKKPKEEEQQPAELGFDPREEARNLDAMLEAMADGLLIGTDGKGGSEVRVTLRDEYFQGTELRIAVDKGEVRATLVPPSIETYRQLSSELHRLRARLEERGLRVSTLDVQRP